MPFSDHIFLCKQGFSNSLKLKIRHMYGNLKKLINISENVYLAI